MVGRKARRTFKDEAMPTEIMRWQARIKAIKDPDPMSPQKPVASRN